MADITQVFLLALLTTVAMGLGALPFLFVGDLTPGWLGASNALASGLMLSASFGLVYEGVVYSLRRTVLGVVLGLAFIVLTRIFLQLRKRQPVGFAEMGALDARKALLIAGVMTLSRRSSSSPS